jgi:ABC-2 type transport system permease protein
MNRILTIVQKDLLELVRDWQTFLFLLGMPIIFTLMFGLAFGGAYQAGSDPRLPVALLNEESSPLSLELEKMLSASEVIRITTDPAVSLADLEKQVSDNDVAGLVIVPAGYGAQAQEGILPPVEIVTSPESSASATVQGEVMASAARLSNAVATAKIVASAAGSISFEQALADSLAAWTTPPIQVKVTSQVVEKKSGSVMSMSHSSPAMMLQFAMAGLLTSAQVMVAERKSRSLQRMLTTATSRVQILLGHFLATYILILIEFMILIVFGQLILKVDYLRVPAGTLFVTLASVLCIAALGTLIGVLAKSDEQAVIFALLPMFILSALGGAWTPLELTSSGFQAVGHFSPVAWAMDGFKNIAARGLGFQSVLLPSAALVGYAVVFFALAAWRFYTMQEK